MTGMRGQIHDTTILLLREISPGTHWLESWVNHRAGLYAVAKRNSPFTPLACHQTPFAQYLFQV